MKFRFNLWKDNSLGTVLVQRGRKQKVAGHTVDLATFEELLLLMLRGALKKLGFKLDLRRWWSKGGTACRGADRNQSYLICPEDTAGGVPQIQLWVDPDRRENLAKDWNKNKEIQLELLGGIYFAPDGVTVSQPNWQELIAGLAEADHHKRLTCKFKSVPKPVTVDAEQQKLQCLLRVAKVALKRIEDDEIGDSFEVAELRDALDAYSSVEPSGVPWCKACNSYHHVDNPGCFRLNPQRPEFDEAYAAEFCVRNGQQSTVPELPTQVELRVVGPDYWFDVAKDGSILQVGGNSIEDGRAAEIVRFDVDEYRSIYPNYKQVDILLLGYWYVEETDGLERYEAPVADYRQAVDAELAAATKGAVHKVKPVKPQAIPQTAAAQPPDESNSSSPPGNPIWYDPQSHS